MTIRLPDGRDAVADYRLPIVKVMRRVNQRIMLDHGNRTGRGPGSARDLADKTEVAQWLSSHPEQACSDASVRAGCHSGQMP